MIIMNWTTLWSRKLRVRSAPAHFTLERGNVSENKTTRGSGHELAPPPLAQHATHIFSCHAGHRRKIGLADPLLEHDMSRAGRLSNVFRQLEQRARHARLHG